MHPMLVACFNYSTWGERCKKEAQQNARRPEHSGGKCRGPTHSSSLLSTTILDRSRTSLFLTSAGVKAEKIPQAS
jgi:hypothetical protein